MCTCLAEPWFHEIKVIGRKEWYQINLRHQNYRKRIDENMTQSRKAFVKCVLKNPITIKATYVDSNLCFLLFCVWQNKQRKIYVLVQTLSTWTSYLLSFNIFLWHYHSVSVLFLKTITMYLLVIVVIIVIGEKFIYYMYRVYVLE